MTKAQLQKRTKQFALRIIKLVDDLPNNTTGRAIGSQLIRCGTSVGANYRSACRARSKAEFIAKLGIVLEEADECDYWLELVVESGLMKKNLVSQLITEAGELTAIFATALKSARSGKKKSE